MLPRCTQAGRCLILESAQQLALPAFPAGGVFTLDLAITELIAAKTAANRRPRYVRSLQYYLRQFAHGREETALAAVATADVEAWLARYPCAYSRQGWLNRLSTLFSWAVRRGHVAANPCDQVERITVDHKPPVVLTPDQAGRLLRECPQLVRPYLALGLFAGIRPEEIMRLDWREVNLETKTVFVDGKTRRRRIVPLEPPAVAWLEAHPLRSGPVAPSAATLTRWKGRARAALGLARFPQDLLRHTAASYLLARHEDAGKVALLLGNSEKILLTHYHQPVTSSAALVFWGMRPDESGKRKAESGNAAPAIAGAASP